MPNTNTLEEAIRDAGEGWLIDMYAPPEQAIPHIRQTLADVNALAEHTLGENALDRSEKSIIAHYNCYPPKVKGFFQVLGGTRSSPILLMAWRIIQGMKIKSVLLNYQRQESFAMQVTLQSPYGDGDEKYSSDKIQDFAVFRHIGTMEVSNSPVFEGFYALRRG
ncbi:MAG: hypothetical protein DWH82_12800 [Planctomycetota bacterium]|nr:MAG: hypothetical protein DWH82_12800 [Planctomycetota bacterium]